MDIRFQNYAIGRPIRLVRQNISSGTYEFSGADPHSVCEAVEGDMITLIKVTGYMRTSTILEKVIVDESEVILVTDNETKTNINELDFIGVE